LCRMHVEHDGRPASHLSFLFLHISHALEVRKRLWPAWVTCSIGCSSPLRTLAAFWGESGMFSIKSYCHRSLGSQLTPPSAFDG
jgi:hypothetical protein